MSREKKRRLSILVSIIGVILLIIVVITSDEFKEKFKMDEEVENVIEIKMTDEEKRSKDYATLEEGVEAEQATTLWQKSINEQLGKGYEVRGDESYDDKNIVYGLKSKTVEKEWNGEPYEAEMEYPWIALLDEKDNVVWVYEEYNGYDYEVIREVIVENNVITTFCWNKSDEILPDEKVIMARYSMEGERITYIPMDIYGDTRVAIANGDVFYIYINAKVLSNNLVYEVKADGNFKKLYECASEADMERYTVSDMAVRDGKLYLSMYARKVEAMNKVQFELEDYFFYEDEDTITIQNGTGEYFTYFNSKKLDKLRKNYSALLCEYHIETGECVQIARVDDRIGSGVSVNEADELVWEVENFITAINYGNFDVAANTEIVEKYYNEANELLREEKSDEIRMFMRAHAFE